MTSEQIDFPFYNGKPAAVSGRQWLIVLIAVACGFLALNFGPLIFRSPLGQFIPAILFSAIPLAALVLIVRQYWSALFRRLRGRDIVWMLTFALLNILVSMVVGFVVLRTLGANPNTAMVALAEMSALEGTLFFLKTIFQLFGEEILTVLPFLALLYLLHTRLQTPRMLAIAVAWLVTALMFGALHLPTYEWNWAQCLIVIGVARLILTIPYLLTNNVLVSTGSHIINDWILLGANLMGAQFVKVAT